MTDEEYYVRHYRKLQTEPVTLGGSCAVDGGLSHFLSMYPRSDPTSPPNGSVPTTSGARAPL